MRLGKTHTKRPLVRDPLALSSVLDLPLPPPHAWCLRPCPLLPMETGRNLSSPVHRGREGLTPTNTWPSRRGGDCTSLHPPAPPPPSARLSLSAHPSSALRDETVVVLAKRLAEEVDVGLGPDAALQLLHLLVRTDMNTRVTTTKRHERTGGFGVSTVQNKMRTRVCRHQAWPLGVLVRSVDAEKAGGVGGGHCFSYRGFGRL